MPTKTNSELSLEAIQTQLGAGEPVTVAMLAALLHDLTAEGHGDSPIFVREHTMVPKELDLIEDGGRTCLAIWPVGDM